MAIELDHSIVPSHHKVASARLQAELPGVPWAASGLSLFVAVYINDGLSADFIFGRFLPRTVAFRKTEPLGSRQA